MSRKDKKINYSIYLVTDRRFCEQRPLESVVELAVSGGVKIVQLREKNSSIKEILYLGERVKKILDKYSVPLIINDRIDIALALDAAGVHLGQKDFSYEEARRILGKEKIIGLSVSTLAEVKNVEHYDVDYLGVGPIFPTATKTDANAPLGLEQLKMIRKYSRHPLVAIGGININNATAVKATGVNGVAVVSAIFAANCPKQATIDLLKKINN